MSREEKFRAAVNVIRSLPKNGSYQPSHDMMLKFYAYFKQGSEGPCTQPKPSFWEVVKKLKWDAWNKLGNMTKEEAMEMYVSELLKIVETMSYNDNVASFMGSLGSFYETVPMGDLELLLGPVIERVRSQPGSPLSSSPFGSREASPQRVGEGVERGHVTSSLETSPASSHSVSPQPARPHDDDDEEDDDDEFIDTVETAPERIVPSSKKPRGLVNGEAVAIPNGHVVNGHGDEGERGRARDRGSPQMPRAKPSAQVPASADHPASRPPPPGQRGGGGGRPGGGDISDQIRETVMHLQRDLDRVTSRVRSLEVSAIPSSTNWPAQTSSRSSWWQFSDLTPRTAALLLAWPFIVHLLVAYWQRRRLRRS